MAVEEGGDGDFFTAESLGDGFEGEVLLLLGGEEDGGLRGQAVGNVVLHSLLLPILAAES